MTNWIDLTDYLPNGFALREGAGDGDPRNGLCYMETVAFIAGEDVTNEPARACPVLTSYGIILNDNMPDDVRQRLIPLAWATAGTRSPEHEHGRLRILGPAACDMAEMVLPVFEAEHPDDDRPRKAIEAARAYWADPSKVNARAAWAAAGDAAKSARDARAAAWAAWSAAQSAWAAGDAAAVASSARDARAAGAAAKAAPDLAPAIWNRAIKALRDAIEAGPHGGIPEADAVARIEARKHELVGSSDE